MSAFHPNLPSAFDPLAAISIPPVADPKCPWQAPIVNGVDQRNMRPEATPAFLLVSIYLWPFFAVWSLNRPSWSGYNRDGFNRFNGIGVLCLLDFLALLSFPRADVVHKLPKAGAVGVLIALFVAHWIWLHGERGERLKQRFADVPAKAKSTVRAISAMAFAGLLVWFFVTLPLSNARPARSIDCGNASAVTAAECM